jgi:hypothetical protein
MNMNQLRLIPVAVLTATLLGGPGLPTFMPSVGTAVAEEMPEEELLQRNKRGKKRSRGQVSRPSVEKKSKKRRRSSRIRSRGIETLPPMVIPDPEPPALPNFELQGEKP